jgi:hypothetical protein
MVTTRRKKRRSKRKCNVGTILQTLLISKETHTSGEAKQWLKIHGFKAGLDIKPNTYRARQVSPSKFNKRSFRTVPIATGIKAVVGCPKK